MHGVVLRVAVPRVGILFSLISRLATYRKMYLLPAPPPQVYSHPSQGLLLQPPLGSLLGQAWEPPPPGSKAPPPSRLLAATRLGHLALLNAQVGCGGVSGGGERGGKCGQQGAAPLPPDCRHTSGPPGPSQRPGWC